MAALKEIKNRIQSVKSTQKITSAMKMVSSAKLRKAQRAVESALPYEQKLSELFVNFISGQDLSDVSPFMVKREVKNVGIIVFSSNSSLCGGFNANVAKQFIYVLDSYKHLGKENIHIYSIGKKITRFSKKIGFQPVAEFDEVADKPDFKKITALSDTIMNLYTEKKLDEVVLIFQHFKSKAQQVITTRGYLPFQISKMQEGAKALDYIVEPDSQTVLTSLIPYVLRTTMFTALLDSNASEHAARVMAMQTATDNADELLQELSLQYNKSRQQAITSELLDIVGGTIGQ